FPTDIGNVVTDFLMEHFKQIMDYNFTAKVEGEFDLIADGKIVWNDMISEFYTPFHKTVSDTMGNAAKSTGERKLGPHPETGQMISARVGRFGPMIQVGEGKDAKFASLRSDQSIETIELSAALELFKLPRIVGELEGKPIKVAIGRFGPYAQHDAKFTSLESTDDPFTISAERTIELILAKRSADSKKVIKEFPENTEVKVLNGKYGPYIVVGKQNVKIPKDKVPADLTLEDCLKLAGADVPTKGAGKAVAKRATKPKRSA
ncbi:MAG: DNA topoisomerase I, partial [Ignavibacteria bacterium]|nr:DNA topoisomerase I [Ignavibacteria bacterium]